MADFVALICPECKGVEIVSQYGEVKDWLFERYKSCQHIQLEADPDSCSIIEDEMYEDDEMELTILRHRDVNCAVQLVDILPYHIAVWFSFDGEDKSLTIKSLGLLWEGKEEQVFNLLKEKLLDTG